MSTGALVPHPCNIQGAFLAKISQSELYLPAILKSDGFSIMIKGIWRLTKYFNKT